MRPHVSLMIIIPGMVLGITVLTLGIVRAGTFGPAEMRTCGLALTIWMLIWLFHHRSRRVERVIFELGRQHGYDEGYYDGRHLAKLTVVPINALRGPDASHENEVPKGVSAISSFRMRRHPRIPTRPRLDFREWTRDGKSSRV